MSNILSVHLYKKGERKPTTICLNVVRYHNVTRDNLLSSQKAILPEMRLWIVLVSFPPVVTLCVCVFHSFVGR